MSDMSKILATARARERARVMREVSSIALQLFEERGYDKVTMQQVADASEVSVATLYRRFGTKENLVCWQPDEQVAMTALATSVETGQSLPEAAMALARGLPDEAVEAIQSTARIRVRLIAEHPAVRAAAMEKSESFVRRALDLSDDRDQRPLLDREVEARCVAAALEAGNRAWLRGEGSLRDCHVRALELLTSPRPA